MNTLVLNLTRFGDLLQTQPVVSGLKNQGRSVSLICLDNFVGATQFLQGISQVFPLSGAGLLADVDRGWPRGLQKLMDWRQNIRANQSFPSLVNLTPMQSARLLARFLTSGPITGFGLDEQGFGFYGNSWAAFLQTSTMHRGCSPFNLVDLMLRSADLPVQGQRLALTPPTTTILDDIRNLLAAEAPPGCRGFVALQLGASETRRQWPQEYFAQLGNLFWERMCLCPVLLGTTAERSLSGNYSVQADHPFIDLVGRTSLNELAAVLCHASLLVTNDTGTMHLAAGLDRPIAAIFLATAQPWDTGPYRAQSLCVEPNLDCHPCAFGTVCPHQEQCRWSITPEQLFALICDHLFSQSPQTIPVPPEPGCCRAWKTTTDQHGFLDLQALSGQEQEFRTQWIRIQRHYYRQFLDQESIVPPSGRLYRLPDDERRRILLSLEQSSTLLQILENQAHVLAATPVEKVKRNFLAYWERLQSQWQSDPHFAVLGRLWLAESQEHGRDLPSIQLLTSRYRNLVHAWQAMFSYN